MVAWPVRAPLHAFSWRFWLKLDADLVLLNGRIITMDHRLPISQGLAVAGGRILLVGDNAGVPARMGPGTEIIDLGWRAVLPGFIEAHCHPPPLWTEPALDRLPARLGPRLEPVPGRGAS